MTEYRIEALTRSAANAVIKNQQRKLNECNSMIAYLLDEIARRDAVAAVAVEVERGRLKYTYPDGSVGYPDCDVIEVRSRGQ